uniref:probable cyclic nucleotide-gated ion channel 3 n=1 Tax=Fragaria vesca subsp. vesca TaxID=101020 RepID=UPI0005CA422D|nr:PREDICTED: probable cyclic nucleotide-gated ion channel 3 [Fragaria vesca subsp. vesca]
MYIQIPVLRKLDEQDLKGFCEHTFITTKDKGTLVTEAGQELFYMCLIIDGVIECNDAETMSTQTMHRYDCVGQELLRWAILNYKRSEEQRERRPISTVDAKCLTDGEAFGIHASDLLEILQKSNNLELASTSSADQRIEEWLLRNGFPEDLKVNIMNCLEQNNLLVEENMHADVDVAFLFGILPRDMKPSMKRHLGMNALKKVPMLQKMHEYVLEIICNYLQPVVYEKDSYIVRAGEPLGIMIFILRGTVFFTDTTSSNTTTTSSSEITENFDENVIEIHGYYGEQLLRWASPNNMSSSDNPVISTRNVKCQTKVEALILKAEDLRNAVSKCGSQWNLINNMNYQHLVGDVRDTLADTGDSTSTKIEETSIQLHQGHDMLLEQLVLIRETMFQFRDDIVRRLDDQGRRLNEMAAFLARLGYTGTSPP